ncbi:ornithine decarboxylase antizyme 1-like [Asterias rubens]|uniref:ornithine decarboxylase antizyme 1-like n=1 Tax=Asterias rubens TaxID=7604 RepID=UPI001455BF41|nr:ornithine decarboxylase antizyme 1-like [Asterias rubens]
MKKRRRKEGSQPSTASSPRTSPPCWSPGSTTYFSFAENPSGIPDVPSGSSQGLVLEDIEETSSADGIFASFFKDGNGASVPGHGDKKFLRFIHYLTDNRKLVWETVLWNKRLYVQVPDDLAHQGSRDSFVALLDAAEEHLGCTQVIIGLRQGAVDRAQLIRTFKFMGFELVPPSHPELPSLADYLFMVSDI